MTLGDVLNQYPSSIIIICMAFAYLWLSLYIFRVNPDDTVSKLASGAVFILFLYFLSNLLVSIATSRHQLILFQRALWWLPLAPVLWLQLSQRLTQPVQFRGAIMYRLGKIINYTRASTVISALYGIAILFLLAGIFTDSLFNFSAIRDVDLPIKNKVIPTGPVYSLFSVYLFLTILAAFVNFLSAWWRERRSQFWWLSVGGALFWLASAGLFIASLTGIRIGYSLGNITLGTGMVIVAIAILRHNALLKKEVLEKDAIYVSIGALGITIVYGITLLIGQGTATNTPVVSLLLITMLALSTHMLADTLKIWFSQIIGTRLGLFTKSDIDKMKHLYHEASKVKRQRGPTVELFNDGDKTINQLLDLLTPRQCEIITLRAKGFSDKQIADTLDIKLPTVRKHVEDIKNRIGSRDKADCAIYCIVTGLLTKDDLVDWFDSLKITDHNI